MPLKTFFKDHLLKFFYRPFLRFNLPPPPKLLAGNVTAPTVPFALNCTFIAEKTHLPKNFRNFFPYYPIEKSTVLHLLDGLNQHDFCRMLILQTFGTTLLTLLCLVMEILTVTIKWMKCFVRLVFLAMVSHFNFYDFRF